MSGVISEEASGRVASGVRLPVVLLLVRLMPVLLVMVRRWW